jgi:MFS family permease
VLVAALAAALPAVVNAAPDQGSRPTLRASMQEGVRWLWGNRLLRTLALTVAVSDVGLGAVFSVLILVSRVRLGLGPLGYGLLLGTSAIGGIAGGLLAERAVAAIGAGWVLRAEMIVEVLTYLGLALTRSAIIAGVLLALLGMHLVMFSTVSASLRQSLAPADMLGRVHGAYRVASNGGLLAGAVLGGLLSTHFGLTAPFVLGFTVLTPMVAVAWGTLNNRDIRTARQPDPADDGTGEKVPGTAGCGPDRCAPARFSAARRTRLRAGRAGLSGIGVRRRSGRVRVPAGMRGAPRRLARRDEAARRGLSGSNGSGRARGHPVSPGPPRDR